MAKLRINLLSIADNDLNDLIHDTIYNHLEKVLGVEIDTLEILDDELLVNIEYTQGE